MCCENHVTRWHWIRHAGYVCSYCASASSTAALTGLVISVIIGVLVYVSYIKPNMDEQKRPDQQPDHEWQQTEPGRHELRTWQKPGR